MAQWLRRLTAALHVAASRTELIFVCTSICFGWVLVYVSINVCECTQDAGEIPSVGQRSL